MSEPHDHSTHKLIPERLDLIKELVVGQVEILDWMGKTHFSTVQFDLAFGWVLTDVLNCRPQHAVEALCLLMMVNRAREHHFTEENLFKWDVASKDQHAIAILLGRGNHAIE